MADQPVGGRDAEAEEREEEEALAAAGTVSAMPLLPAAPAQLAGGAVSAAIAPGVALCRARRGSRYACARRISSTSAAPPSCSRQRPGRRLVDPHQRRVETKRASMPRLSATCSALMRVVAAIGVAGIIRLAHAADEVLQPAPVGQGGGEGEEQQVAAGTKVLGRPFACIAISMSRVSAVSEICAQRGELEHDGPRPACRPVGVSARSRARNVGAALEFDARGAGRSRSRRSRHARSAAAPRRGRSRNPGRR